MKIYLLFHFIYNCIQWNCVQWNCIQNKISPGTGTLLNGVLRPKLLNIPLASYFLINLGFLLPHIANFTKNIVLPLLVSETFCILTLNNTNNKMALFNFY